MFRKKRKISKYRPAYHGNRRILKPKRKSGINRQSEKIKQSRRKKRSSRLKPRLIVALSALLCIFIAYWTLLSGTFTITKIEISGESFTNESLSVEIEESLNEALGKNLIFIDLEELQLKATEAFPKLQEIKIQKDYPNKIFIDFKEYDLAANIINESTNLKKNFIINAMGYVVKEDFENPALPYIKIKSDEAMNPNSIIIEKNKLDYILGAVADFETRFNLKITEIHYKKIARELHLTTEKDFIIWIDIQQSYEDQFKKLKKALVKIDIYTESLEYIDLRIAGNNGDKIIYKRKQRI